MSADLDKGRRIGKLGQSPRCRDGQQLDLSGSLQLDHCRDFREHHVDVTGDQVVERWRRALVRDMDEIYASSALK